MIVVASSAIFISHRPTRIFTHHPRLSYISIVNLNQPRPGKPAEVAVSLHSYQQISSRRTNCQALLLIAKSPARQNSKQNYSSNFQFIIANHILIRENATGAPLPAQDQLTGIIHAVARIGKCRRPKKFLHLLALTQIPFQHNNFATNLFPTVQKILKTRLAQPKRYVLIVRTLFVTSSPTKPSPRRTNGITPSRHKSTRTPSHPFLYP